MSDSNMPPTNPRWQTTAILKTVKSRYLRHRLIYRDKIGKQMQVAPPDTTESKKNEYLKPTWRAAAILKWQQIYGFSCDLTL